VVIEIIYLVSINMQQLLILFFYYQLDEQQERARNRRFSMQTASHYDLTDSQASTHEKITLYGSDGPYDQGQSLSASLLPSLGFVSSLTHTDHASHLGDHEFEASRRPQEWQNGSKKLLNTYEFDHSSSMVDKRFVLRAQSDPAIMQAQMRSHDQKQATQDEPMRVNKITKSIVFRGVKLPAPTADRKLASLASSQVTMSPMSLKVSQTPSMPQYSHMQTHSVKSSMPLDRVFALDSGPKTSQDSNTTINDGDQGSQDSDDEQRDLEYVAKSDSGRFLESFNVHRLERGPLPQAHNSHF